MAAPRALRSPTGLGGPPSADPAVGAPAAATPAACTQAASAIAVAVRARSGIARVRRAARPDGASSTSPAIARPGLVTGRGAAYASAAASAATGPIPPASRPICAGRRTTS